MDDIIVEKSTAPRVFGRRVNHEVVVPSASDPAFLDQVRSGTWSAAPRPPVAVHGGSGADLAVEQDQPPEEKQTLPEQTAAVEATTAARPPRPPQTSRYLEFQGPQS